MSYLQRRGGKYAFRCRVPLDLVYIFGRSEIKRSLRTADRRAARRRAAALAAAAHAAFEKARAMQFSDEDKDKLLEQLFRDLDAALETIEKQKELLARQKYLLELQHEIDTLKRDENWKAIIDSVFSATDKHLALTKDLLARFTLSRAQRDEARRALDALAQAVAAARPAAAQEAAHTDARKTLMQILPQFFKDKPQNEKRKREYEVEIARFERAVGKIPLHEIRRRHVDQYHDLLLAEVKPRKNGDIASVDTQKKALSCIKSVLQWATDTERIEKNYAARVAPKGVSRRDHLREKRRAWTAEELRKIFNAPLFTGCKSKWYVYERGKTLLLDDGRYWMPLVALMTGARLGELAQMKINDVRLFHDSGNIHYLSVKAFLDAEEDEGSVKTEYSRRLLPIHPELIKLGFLDYAKRRRAKIGGNALLFEKLDYTKFYNNKDRFFDRIGVKRPDTSFHSFRHTFKDMLRVLRDPDLRDRLMGHAPRSVGETYGSPLTPAEIRDFFEKVKPPVPLEHLHMNRLQQQP